MNTTEKAVEREFYSIREAAYACCLSETTIRLLIKTEALTAYKVAGKYLIDKQDLRDLVTANRHQPENGAAA